MRWTPALLFLVLAACTPTGGSESLPQELPTRTARAPGDSKARPELYDEAGFPDVSGLRRVEFEAEYGVERGWLLSTTPLVLLRDSLWILEPERAAIPEFMRDPTGEPEAPSEPFSYREVDFADELRAELEAVEALTQNEEAWRNPFGMDARLVSLPAYWLVRARWAAMRGHSDLSRRAFVQFERWTNIECDEGDCTRADAVRQGFQHRLLWQATDGLREFMPRLQVRELLARALAIAPESNAAPLVSELLARLDRTIATDIDEPTWPEADDPDREERLIHLLREHTHRRGPIRNPAAELAALGREAVPALIEHIDDDSLTRSLSEYRRYNFDVLTVGDVAVEILEQIASRSFYTSRESLPMSYEGQTKAVQQSVREWWAGAHEHSGQEQLLRDLGDAEGHDRVWLADRLLRNYGMEIWPELLRTFAETTDERTRESLLQTMNYLPDDEGDEPAEVRETIEQFLVGALEDRSLLVRLVAARCLIERGRRDGTETMIRDLDHYWLDPDAWSGRTYYESYFAVLAADGSAEAVDAINRAVRRGGYAAVDGLSSGGCRWPEKECNPKLDPAAKARLLDTLAEYLDDFHDPGGSWGEGPARIRDMAAAAYLVLTGQDQSALASEQTSLERDRMILDLLNTHRAQQDRPPLSWPHLAPLQGTPGRDHVQRVHLLRAVVHEAAAREWLAGFVDRDLNLQEISTAFVDLARRHPDVPFTLRILRFPADAGVMLTLEAGPPAPDPGRLHSGVACWGSECRAAGQTITRDSATEIFDDFLQDHVDGVWDRAPTRIEEYVLQLKVSPAKLGGLAQGCACTAGDDLDVDFGWLLVIAGLFPAVLALRRAIA